MTRVASRSSALVVVGLLLLTGLLPLLAVQPVRAAMPHACCDRHQPASTPFKEHPADHLCCMVGHNHALLTSTTGAAPVQLGCRWQNASPSDAPVFTQLLDPFFGGSSPPAGHLSPLRI